MIRKDEEDSIANVVQKCNFEGKLEVIGSFSDAEDCQFSFKLIPGNNYLSVSNRNGDTFTVLYFEPPNFRNLEYFTIDPIMLQSVGSDELNDPDRLSLKIQNQDILKEYMSDTISSYPTLSRINNCLKIEGDIKRVLASKAEATQLEISISALKWYINRTFRPIKNVLLNLMISFIKSIQNVSLIILIMINKEICGIKLTKISRVAKQLNLRLQQILFFPVQFLFYYDRNLLLSNPKFLSDLDFPIHNSDLNVVNSNYINLYNTIWMIFNDVLLGMMIWRIIVCEMRILSLYVNDFILKSVLFEKVYSVIYWISYDHPAGFKLNNNLGKFLGELYLYYLRFWSLFISILISLDPEESMMTQGYYDAFSYFNLSNTAAILGFLRWILVHSSRLVLCRIGFSFLIAFFVDYFRLITFHINSMYFTSANIYQKQLSIIMSLFQLFRGKKYNVLRNRVDKLDNYSNQGQFFELDRFLLGTLFFMIMIFLMPTVFAFYLVCFLMRLCCILVLNLAENILIVVNFFPSFMIVLKLKNSRRLQGGINVRFLNSVQNTTNFLLSNKSLSYNDIFRNFMLLFRESKNFRNSLLKDFVLGEPIHLKSDEDIIRKYLMLPRNPENTARMWSLFDPKI